MMQKNSRDISSWNIDNVGDFFNMFNDKNSLSDVKKCNIDTAWRENDYWKQYYDISTNDWTDYCST